MLNKNSTPTAASATITLCQLSSDQPSYTQKLYSPKVLKTIDAW